MKSYESETGEICPCTPRKPFLKEGFTDPKNLEKQRKNLFEKFFPCFDFY